MKRNDDFALVLVTAPDMKVARGLARAALQARLIACANLIPKLESHYWWRAKIESGDEVLLLLKTSRAKLAQLEKLLLSKHPYDTPEFVVLPISRTSRRYADWLRSSLKPEFLSPREEATPSAPGSRQQRVAGTLSQEPSVG
jgi:periplasmic divalent cation tolerance protein